VEGDVVEELTYEQVRELITVYPWR